MARFRDFILKGVFGIFLLIGVALGQSGYVYFVELQNEQDANPYDLYQSKYDGKVFLLSEEDVLPLLLSVLDPFILEQTSLNEEESFFEVEFAGSSCFIPTGKLITEDYTYIFSTYSFDGIVFKNAAPYTPSSQVISTNIPYSDELVEWLFQLQNTYYSPEHLTQIQMKFSETMYCDATFEANFSPLEEEYQLEEGDFLFVYKPLIDTDFNYSQLILNKPLEEEIQEFARIETNSIHIEE